MAMHKWVEAANRYRASKQPGFRKRRKSQRDVLVVQRWSSLEEFMKSDDCKAAKELLEAAHTYVILSESETMMSQTTSVCLDGDGLCLSTQVVGMAAAYTEQKPEKKSVDVDEALENIRDFEDTHNETGIVREIYRGCNIIATAAP